MYSDGKYRGNLPTLIVGKSGGNWGNSFMKKKLHKNTEGISLLSSLVTVGIMGVIALAATSIFYNSTRNVGQSKHYESARFVEQYAIDALHCCNTLAPHLALLGTKTCDDIHSESSATVWRHATEPAFPATPTSKFSMRAYNTKVTGTKTEILQLDAAEGYKLGDWTIYVKCKGTLTEQRYLTVELSSVKNNLQTDKSYDVPFELSGAKLCSAIFNDPGLCT